MTELEWSKFSEAVNRLKASGEWAKIAEVHVQSMTQVHESHASAIFLPWHRKFQIEVENRLQVAMNDCSITIPYWNWALELSGFTRSSVWASDRFGSLNQYLWGGSNADALCVKDGAFGSQSEMSAFGKNDNELTSHAGASDCVMRRGSAMTNFNYAQLKAHLQQKDMNMTVFDYMSWFLEYDVHNAFHIAVGGSYMGHLGHMSTMSSPYDPIFFLHHGFVDFLFQQWQDTHVEESQRWAHRQHDLMNRLLFDGVSDAFPVTDVIHSMDVMDDDPDTDSFEKSCVVYNERRQSSHACDANWDAIQTCLAQLVTEERLHLVPRIKVMTSVGDVCSPLNPIESDLDRMWLENMAKMGMLEESKVGEILEWEAKQNTDIAIITPEFDASEATECDKTLCFSTAKLLEMCGHH